MTDMTTNGPEGAGSRHDGLWRGSSPAAWRVCSIHPRSPSANSLTRRMNVDCFSMHHIKPDRSAEACAIEVSGVNYMMPVDSKVKQENQISDETVNIEYFLNAVETASKLRLVILDACRDNPFILKVRSASASRSAGSLAPSQVGRGLSRIEPQPGTLVVFAAKQGQVALDGDGQNSPFVEALVKRIEQQPALEVRRLFDFVRDDVFKATKKEQQP